jgi:THO complex subunit 2
LDPSRALDVILDVFLANIGTHYTFFLALLSLSPWAGSAKGMVLEDFPEGSDTPDVPDMSIDDDGTYAQQEQAESPSPFSGKTLDEILEMSEPAFLKFPPSSDSHNVLAQVLGFKFCYYTVNVLLSLYKRVN